MPPADGRLRVQKSISAPCVKRRHSRVAPNQRTRRKNRHTRVEGVPLGDEALAQLGKQLRTACGSGGTVKGGVIEVQGDHCDKVIDALKQEGYAPKRSGG